MPDFHQQTTFVWGNGQGTKGDKQNIDKAVESVMQLLAKLDVAECAIAAVGWSSTVAIKVVIKIKGIFHKIARNSLGFRCLLSGG